MHDAQINTLLSLVQSIQGLAATAEQILADAAGLVEVREPEPESPKRLAYLGDDEPEAAIGGA